MNLNKLLKIRTLLYVLVSGFTLVSTAVNSTTITYGYTLQSYPNRFFPNLPEGIFWSTYYTRTGTLIQQQTAANNPDIYCESQDNFYRVPAVGELTSAGRSFVSGGTQRPLKPPVYHWSNYKDNNIGGTLLPVVTGRAASGSLFNEWGALDKYNGWSVPTGISPHLWGVEPSNSYGNYAGRATMTLSGGASTLYTYNQASIVCVRDLVPTPSTPIPTKVVDVVNN